MIDFIEHHSAKYAGRTSDNVIESDATIAFAIDFKSPGEELTKHYCQLYNKPFIPVQCSHLTFSPVGSAELMKIISVLKKNTVCVLNVAGNSMYTFRKNKADIYQEDIDKLVLNTLARITLQHRDIKLIRSGGQSGADEAGLKAAVKLNIGAYCLSPKGWPYLTSEGATVYNEFLFKQRFKVSE